VRSSLSPFGPKIKNFQQILKDYFGHQGDLGEFLFLRQRKRLFVIKVKNEEMNIL
jgi:hypothetical protein